MQLSEHFTYRKIIKFTIPSIIMMIFTSIYTVIDGIFVSNVVGDEAFASVNLIYPFIAILGAFGFMVGSGGSAIVSKTIGEGKKEKAKKYFSMLIYFIILIGVILTIFGVIFIRQVSKLLGADSNTLENCVIYGRVMILGITAFMLQNTFQSFLIVAERQKFGLIISIIAGICNIIGDFILIYVCKLGVLGAGLATILSQYVGGIIPLIYFTRKNKSNLSLVKAKFEGKIILKACTNGSSEMLTNVSMSVVNIFYNLQLMKLIGADGVVAYGIITYIAFIFVAVFIGYSIGTAAIIGYNYGADNKEELKSLLKKSCTIIGIFGLLMTVLSEISSNLLASIFVSYDNNLLELTVNAIRIFALSFLFSGFNIFASSFFTALNNGLVSAIISFLRTLVFQVLMIFLLPMFLGVNGIWSSVVVAEILSIIVVIFLIIKNKSKYGYI